MKRNLFRFSSAFLAALAVAACTDDPTEAFRGGATNVATSLSYVEILIADSVVLTAQTRDAQGNALSALPELTAAAPAIASVNTDTIISGKPSPETQFSILANGFGTATVTASSGGLSTDITVQTWPAAVTVTGTGVGGQVASGGTVQLTSVAVGTDGNAFSAGAGDLTMVYSSTGAAGTASVDATGLATAASPGLAVISVAATRTADGAATGATGQASFEVVPGAFDGTVPAGTLTPMSVATLTAGAVPFDSDTKVIFDGFEIQWVNIAAGGATLDVIIEDWGAGTLDFLLTDVGPNQLAYAFTMDVGAYARPADPTAAPDITAGPFPLTVYASIDDTDIDAFFALAPAAATAYTATMSWNNGADVDILWYDATGACCYYNFDGATGANPEVSSTPPFDNTVAGGAIVLNADMWDSHGDGRTTVKIDVTSP